MCVQCSFPAFSEAGYAFLLGLIEWLRNYITAAMLKFDIVNGNIPSFSSSS